MDVAKEKGCSTNVAQGEGATNSVDDVTDGSLGWMFRIPDEAEREDVRLVAKMTSKKNWRRAMPLLKQKYILPLRHAIRSTLKVHVNFNNDQQSYREVNCG